MQFNFYEQKILFFVALNLRHLCECEYLNINFIVLKLTILNPLFSMWKLQFFSYKNIFL